MSPIAPAAPAPSVSAPTLASTVTTATSAPSGQTDTFGAAMASAEAPAPRKAVAPHSQNAAAAGAAMPPHGKIAPQPPVSAPLATLVPTMPMPAGLTASKVPIEGESGAPPQGLAKATDSTMVGRTVLSNAAPVTAAEHESAIVRDVAAAGDAASARGAVDAAVSQEITDGPADAAAATGTGLQADAAMAAAALADSPAAQAAAAATAAADRLVAVPDGGSASPLKGSPSLAPNTVKAPGSTATTPDVPPSAGITIAASIVPVLAQQNAGGADKHTHDGATNASESAIDAAASIAAGEAGVHGLGAAQSAVLTPASAPPAPDLYSSQFPDQLATHVSYLVDQNLNGATLQVNPPQLGPIELRVSIDAGHAQVWLSAHSAAACDALQQSSSKLRDMLASQGFGQVSVDVSQRSFQDRSANAQIYVWSGAAEPTAQTVAAVPQPWSARTAAGVLDAYA